MLRLILRRFDHGKDYTYGLLTHPDMGILAATLENPWKNNEPYISCIPTKNGFYLCKRIHSPRFGDTFKVTNVDGRTHILFHKGNTEPDTKGCILLGSYFGIMGGKRAIFNSKKAFDDFMKIVGGLEEFELDIK
jgi:hypothetical protein